MELKILKAKEHSESIWCPHCGEEFGIESEINQAYEDQAKVTARQIIEIVERHRKQAYAFEVEMAVVNSKLAENAKEWQALKELIEQ